jgi:3-oxoacyl-[acyl-carrier protein] reductase
MQSHFLTAIAAGKVMIKKGSSVILSLAATPGCIGYPYTGGFAPACCAIESFSRNLTFKLRVYGIRNIKYPVGRLPRIKTFKEAIEDRPGEVLPIIRK